MIAKPNILFMIMDDQRFDTIRALGNDIIHTPTLDRIARTGTFLQAHTTVPVCTPGRAEVLTGCCAYDNGCRWFGEPIHDHLTLMPRALQQAGYHTCHIGKWHNNGHPADSDKGHHEAHLVFPNDLADSYYGKRGYWKIHEFEYMDGDQKVKGHSTEVLARETIDFVKRAPEDQPWFCYMALHSPHDPRRAPEPFASMYDPRTMPLPDNFMPEHPFDNGDMNIRDELLEGFPRRPARIQQHLGDYYAMITHHDYWMGQILEALEQRGQLDNTIIVFTSDHGLAVGSHGLMGKENLYEHSQSVPVLIAGPGLPQGHHARFLVQHYDLYPTLCELAEVPIPDTVKGRSYATELANEAEQFRDVVCCSYRDCMRSIRNDRWKLIHYPKINRTQLFDLHNDPHECSDLLADWRHALAGSLDWEARQIHETNDMGLYPEWPQQDLQPSDLSSIANDLMAQLRTRLKQKDDPLPE